MHTKSFIKSLALLLQDILIRENIIISIDLSRETLIYTKCDNH